MAILLPFTTWAQSADNATGNATDEVQGVAPEERHDREHEDKRHVLAVVRRALATESGRRRLRASVPGATDSKSLFWSFTFLSSLCTSSRERVACARELAVALSVISSVTELPLVSLTRSSEDDRRRLAALLRREIVADQVRYATVQKALSRAGPVTATKHALSFLQRETDKVLLLLNLDVVLDVLQLQGEQEEEKR